MPKICVPLFRLAFFFALVTAPALALAQTRSEGPWQAYTQTNNGKVFIQVRALYINGQYSGEEYRARNNMNTPVCIHTSFDNAVNVKDLRRGGGRMDVPGGGGWIGLGGLRPADLRVNNVGQLDHSESRFILVFDVQDGTCGGSTRGSKDFPFMGDLYKVRVKNACNVKVRYMLAVFRKDGSKHVGSLHELKPGKSAIFTDLFDKPVIAAGERYFLYSEFRKGGKTHRVNAKGNVFELVELRKGSWVKLGKQPFAEIKAKPQGSGSSRTDTVTIACN